MLRPDVALGSRAYLEALVLRFRRPRILRIAPFLALLASSSWAQSVPSPNSVDQHAQTWGVATLNAPLSERFRIFGEAQPHFGFDQNTSELHGLFGFQITPSVSIWQGYAWTPTLSPKYIDEQRIYQQLTFEQLLGRVKLTHRTRLEERWIPTATGSALRVRHMEKTSIPLGPPDGYALVASDEFFFNLNSPTHGPHAGPDQNRLFLGFGHPVSDQATLEMGYLNNYIWRAAAPDRMNHVFLVQVNVKLLQRAMVP